VVAVSGLLLRGWTRVVAPCRWLVLPCAPLIPACTVTQRSPIDGSPCRLRRTWARLPWRRRSGSCRHQVQRWLRSVFALGPGASGNAWNLVVAISPRCNEEPGHGRIELSIDPRGVADAGPPGGLGRWHRRAGAVGRSDRPDAHERGTSTRAFRPGVTIAMGL